MTTLTLTCLPLGDHPDKNFEVQVPENMKETLQSNINLSDTFEDVPPKDIEIWKVEIPTRPQDYFLLAVYGWLFAGLLAFLIQ